MKKNIILILLLTLLGVCPAGCGSAQEYISEQLEAAAEDEAKSSSGNDAAEIMPSAREVIVHISGAVAKPGVYSLNEGSRLFDAVELAGGFNEEADESYLNLAAVLEDGQKYHVPTTEEAENLLRQQAASSDGKIDINTAGVEELTKLSGIGEGKAKAIVAYRDEHGVFATVEDIMKVSGIGEGTYSKFKDEITVR